MNKYNCFLTDDIVKSWIDGLKQKSPSTRKDFFIVFFCSPYLAIVSTDTRLSLFATSHAVWKIS